VKEKKTRGETRRRLGSAQHKPKILGVELNKEEEEEFLPPSPHTHTHPPDSYLTFKARLTTIDFNMDVHRDDSLFFSVLKVVKFLERK
jgi:hypothetical protein